MHNRPIQIEIKGLMGAGKTMLLYEIAHHLSSKGCKVRAIDNLGEVEADDCFPIHKEYDDENTIYITTSLERVDESVFPEKPKQ